MINQALVSIIIPVYNNSDFLRKSLASINESSYINFEVIVVDDASTIDIKSLVVDKVRYFRLDKRSGPAAARNLGASHANGDLLLFLDSDILIKPDTIFRLVTGFKENPDNSAIFGSYDSEPFDPDYLSQYKNLLHHFVHQNSSSDAYTFWAGCGAVIKVAFDEVGGFNEKKYKKPSIEDIELGYRLREKAYKIFLDKDLQVKHLKSWSFLNWIKVEIFNRAIPWSKLIIQTGIISFDLNLKISDRLSAVSSWLILFSILNILLSILTAKAVLFSLHTSLILLICSFISFLFFNKRFYRFLLRERGWKFSIIITPFHLLYYLYSSASYCIVYIMQKTLDAVKRNKKY